MAARTSLVIKPSGHLCDTGPEAMVVCDLDGNLVLGRVSTPRTPPRTYVYRHMSEVGGVVHTH